MKRTIFDEMPTAQLLDVWVNIFKDGSYGQINFARSGAELSIRRWVAYCIRVKFKPRTVQKRECP